MFLLNRCNLITLQIGYRPHQYLALWTKFTNHFFPIVCLCFLLPSYYSSSLVLCVVSPILIFRSISSLMYKLISKNWSISFCFHPFFYLFVFHCIGGLFSSLFSRLFGEKERRILILGLDGAGKTTILYRLQVGEVVSTIPSIYEHIILSFDLISNKMTWSN